MSLVKKCRHVAEYAGFRTGVFLLRLMPLETASAVCGWLFRKLAPLGKRHQRAHDNLARAIPELDREQRADAIDGMWDMLGRITAETVLIDRLSRQPERIVFSDAHDLIADVIGRNQGSVFVSMHAGNWELCPYPGLSLGVQPASIYQTLKNPYVDKYVRNRRSILSTGGIFEKGASTARKLIKFIKAGGHIGMLVDQRNRQGITVPFFGLEAPTHTLPALLAIKLGVPLLCMRVIRHRDVHFTIEALEIEVSATGNRSHDVYETTKRINDVFEKWIREHPEQWMWGHLRWEHNAKPMS